MALTPEDVVNKRFQPTKFREGYDQDEVDDFLDEVVVELRRLNQENEELRQRLSAGDSRLSDLQRDGGAAAAPAPVVDEAPAPEPEPEPEPEPAPAPVVAPVASQAAPVDEAESSSGLLQLARRLHEEHVREGAEKRDALVAEGRATAARLVAEAEAKQRAQIAKLDEERAAVEERIDGLRTFEREYRQKLKSYIEGQLRDLDTQPVSAEASSFPGFGA
ncbi:DivIVA domain-containing protein [Rathayibacter sp. VKM Ac-2803]|uniref:DivIVA domain-containing protein n=1 Tax=unclassified Rathayibacter TaxID=2609250 RepID=UPI0013599C09|nr:MULTISPECIES: DivIVA domain-containing protein [unclassified Rathayibacter]MWV49693.1 DivIVA domain-containing protein [Rathayibacter sp. VKM Ac-2803]MWV59826.1 DivIVA domain-containing protein [Rathayibacter sp. VKM Ac-2754]